MDVISRSTLAIALQKYTNNYIIRPIDDTFSTSSVTEEVYSKINDYLYAFNCAHVCAREQQQPNQSTITKLFFKTLRKSSLSSVISIDDMRSLLRFFILTISESKLGNDISPSSP